MIAMLHDWAVWLHSDPPWFGSIPAEVLPLVLRDSGVICSPYYVAEGPGVWVEGTDKERVRASAAIRSRPGKLYSLWKRVVEVGGVASIYRLVERTKVRHEPDVIFSLVEFLERVGDVLGVEKSTTPMDPVEFHKYVLKVLRSWSSEMGAIRDAYIDKLLEVLEGRDWSQATMQDLEAELRALMDWVPKEVYTSSVHMIGTGEKISWDLAVFTRSGLIRLYELGLDTSFNLQDTKAIERLSSWSFRQIPVSYVRMSQRLSQTLQRMLISGLASGEHYTKVTEAIAKQVPEIVTRQQVHFLNVTAQNALARARTQAQLLTYRDARVSVIRLAAVMDERTTPQCSFLNNQIIGVNGPLQYMESALQRDEDPREAFPWIASKKDAQTGNVYLEFSKGGTVYRFAESDATGKMQYKDGWSLEKLVPYGVGLPPYHALCRSTTYIDYV